MTDQTPAADIVEPTPEVSDLARRIVSEFRPNGWAAKEGEIAHLLARCNQPLHAEIEALRAILAEMPTVMEDPAGKGYPCQERPMTPAEARDVIEALRAREAELRRKLDEVVKALTCCLQRLEGNWDATREVEMVRSALASILSIK